MVVCNVGLYYTKFLLMKSLGKLNGVLVEEAYQVRCSSSLMNVLIIRCSILVSSKLYFGYLIYFSEACY